MVCYSEDKVPALKRLSLQEEADKETGVFSLVKSYNKGKHKAAWQHTQGPNGWGWEGQRDFTKVLVSSQCPISPANFREAP